MRDTVKRHRTAEQNTKPNTCKSVMNGEEWHFRGGGKKPKQTTHHHWGTNNYDQL